jgi:dolichol-phosphate mannosyltransferase
MESEGGVGAGDRPRSPLVNGVQVMIDSLHLCGVAADAQPDLSVVIPAYLEEENLREMLPRLLTVLSKTGVTHEVLVIDTLKPIDLTHEVCAELGPPVRYLNRTVGNNFGDANRTGIKESIGKWVLFMDADGSHSPEYIPSLLDHMGKADLVVASRYVQGGATENPASLVLMSRILNFVYAVALGIGCRDVSNSFKLYRGDVLKEISLRCDHFDIVEEIFVKYAATLDRPRIVEVPFVFKKRRFGDTKRNLPMFVFSFFVTLIRLVLIKFMSKKKSIRQIRASGLSDEEIAGGVQGVKL